MTDRREQLEMLLSRLADEDLTAEERGIVQNAAGQDEVVAAEIRRYERLDAILSSWRRPPSDLDWSEFHRDVSKAVMTEQHHELDAAVREAVGPLPAVDWSAFKSRVSSAIRAEAEVSEIHASTTYRMPAAIRWFVPIGIAAGVAFAFFRTGGGTLPIQPNQTDRPPIVLVSLDFPESSGKISIDFDESPAPEVEEGIAPGTAYVFSELGGLYDYDEETEAF